MTTTDAAMQRTRWRRVPGAGLVGGLLLFFGPSGYGDTPDTRDTTAEVAAYFVDNRTGVFVATVLLGAGLVAVVAVAARIGDGLAAAGEGPSGRFVVAMAGFAAGILATTTVLINASLSYVIGEEVPDMAKGLFELTLVATPVAALPLAAMTGATAVGLHRTGLGRRWFVVLSAAVAVAGAIGSCSFAAAGPFSPDVQQQVVLGLLSLWMLASGPGTAARSTV